MVEMQFFRKRPIVIQAFQWFEHMGAVGGVLYALGYYYIPTLEGPMRPRDGDRIITGVNREQYPCKPDIFAKTYEPVNDSL